MLINKLPVVSMGRSIFHSLRFELVFVLLFGLVVPISLTVGLSAAYRAALPSTINSLIGAGVCALVMVMALRRFRVYPGAPVARSVLPVIASAYAAFLAAVVTLRIDYSVQILLACFIGTVAARFTIETLHIRAKRLVYYVVPGGKAEIVHTLSAPTIPLVSPSVVALPSGAIIADLHADLAPEWVSMLAEAAIAGKPVYHYKQVWEAQTGKVQIHHLSENSFGALVPSFAYQKVKRLVDLAVCVLVLPIALLIIFVCAALIKADSAGPIFFYQRRMGFRGKVFHVIKFRSMSECHDGENREMSVTQTDDHRITRIGRFLRRTRLDELPQIFNILLGDMSWIGPRPEAVSLSRWYENEIPFYRYRHIVRPGISGWAQVNQGHVSSLGDINDKLQYDFYYIKNLSYWLDILIAGRTVRVVLGGFGAK